MHDLEKSDSAVVAAKSPNKAGSPAAEAVEQRAGTKGNADQQSTHRTQTRERVTQALNRVRHCKAKEEGAVHRASPPCQRRHALDGVLRAQTQSRRRCRRGDMAGLRGGPRAESRGPPWKGPQGSVSAATISPDVHTEGGRSTKAAGDRSSGRQDRPGRMCHSAQRHLRRGFPRVLIRVPTWTRAAGCVGCFGGGDHQPEGESHT